MSFTSSCTLCGGSYVRASRRPIPWIARAVGLVLFRSQTCWELFLLPRRLRSSRLAPQAVSRDQKISLPPI